MYLVICGRRGERYGHLSIRKLLHLHSQQLPQVYIQSAHTNRLTVTIKHTQNELRGRDYSWQMCQKKRPNVTGLIL